MIKFRAWDKEYGHMYQNAYPFEHLVYVEMHDDDETFEQFKHKMMVINGKHFYFIIAKDMELMQYTGLADKNGRDIYEGDIVRAETYKDYKGKQRIEMLQVEYIESVLKPFHEIIVGNDYWCDAFAGQYEVIGNIYEHAHLLEQSTNE